MPRLPRAFWTVALVALAFGVGVLALTPAPPPLLDTGWDKLNHALAFAALAFCAQHAAAGSRWPTPVWLGIVGAFGVLIELAQTQVPGRHAEWFDLAADAVGLAIGAALARWALRTQTGVHAAATAATQRRPPFAP